MDFDMDVSEREYLEDLERLKKRAMQYHQGQPFVVSPRDMPALIAALNEVEDLRNYAKLVRSSIRKLNKEACIDQ